MQITDLTVLAFYLNAALDTGKYADLTFKEVADCIEDGSIFNLLKKRLGNDIDISIYDRNKQNDLIAEWQDLLNTVSAYRKFGVENNGLCLLISYLLEGIQRRQYDSLR